MKTTEYKINNQELAYEVVDNGYKIYKGGRLWIKQLEPYIPNPTLSYEENALAQIEALATSESENKSLQEQVAALEQQLTDTQLALCELYESLTTTTAS